MPETTHETARARGEKHLVELTHDELVVILLSFEAACSDDLITMKLFAKAILKLGVENFIVLQQKITQAHASTHECATEEHSND